MVGFFITLILYKIWVVVKGNEFKISQIDLKVQKAQEEGINKLIDVVDKVAEKKTAGMEVQFNSIKEEIEILTGKLVTFIETPRPEVKKKK